MNSEQKKLVILLSLFAVFGCIGVFQFLGSPATPPEVEKKPVVSSAKDGEKVVKNPEVRAPLPMRDPFEAPTEAEAPAPAKTANATTSVSKEEPANLGQLKPLPFVGPVPTATTSPLTGSTEPSSAQYRLVGVINGPHPAAVIEDGNQHQHLLQVGEHLDSATKLLSISAGAIQLSVRGKTIRLTPGDKPNVH